MTTIMIIVQVTLWVAIIVNLVSAYISLAVRKAVCQRADMMEGALQHLSFDFEWWLGFRTVSLREHARCVLLMRDPLRIYPPVVSMGIARQVARMYFDCWLMIYIVRIRGTV